MQRYFIPESKMTENQVTIEGEDVKHISRVMRMTTGDHIICCSEEGRSALCRIIEIESDLVSAVPEQWLDEKKKLPVHVTIVQGMPKGDKLETVIQKGTELGADTFLPFKAERSVVKWDQQKSSKKLQRLRKIAKEAAEQSHRTTIPSIEEPYSITSLIEISKSYEHKLIAYEEEAKAGESAALVQALHEANVNDRFMIVFGPEGGLSDKEVDWLKDAGFTSCGLGPRILRTETAAMYVLAAISYHFELMR
ncbi:16S rRNA (uracil(1498)-N(3))-methyltransferase [Pseudalkalibacillus hwajinpoensis]|uniref:Ribosomal RNA small subunit methyltransferase E n=1 Tax=Guptibacillus hwajinpoensis TaxID=208199 RepID=A0A4U1MIJ3_9BACL|nr:16S rRNA (uracil(1498)-N(3))-methyltransferase [Pseudalkalibacillus hwajinpoensis]TKD70180.1 16S rRNA (uracil(1498)-N(3))-methyltransferase [Pseudalkalibacillus hwajinpoensis]